MRHFILPNYSYGHIVQFQIEEYLKGKNFAGEIDRMYSQGRLTPQQWMTGATGSKISTQPLLNALDQALESRCNYQRLRGEIIIDREPKQVSIAGICLNINTQKKIGQSFVR